MGCTQEALGVLPPNRGDALGRSRAEPLVSPPHPFVKTAADGGWAREETVRTSALLALWQLNCQLSV